MMLLVQKRVKTDMVIIRLFIVLFVFLSLSALADEPNDGGIGGTGHGGGDTSFDIFEVPDVVDDIELELPTDDISGIPEIHDDALPDFDAVEGMDDVESASEN